MIDRAFFEREDVLTVARELVGTYLVSKVDDRVTVGRIVETEGYRAPDDRACHAYGNLRTARTETMFQQAGTAYVYLCYGIHHLFNVVTAREGIAHAVLIRAIEPVKGLETMVERRGMEGHRPQLTAGPGVLTQAMGISRELHNGIDLCDPEAELNLLLPPEPVLEHEIAAGPRVGVSGAGEVAANLPWRFYIKGNRWVSRWKA